MNKTYQLDLFKIGGALADREAALIEQLQAIKDERLWFGWPSFDAYCRERLGMRLDRIAPQLSDESRERFPVTGGVYFIQAGGDGGHVKIGVARDVEMRLQQLQTGSPVRHRIIGVIFGRSYETESELHRRFASDRVSGEWFLPSARVMYAAEHEAIPMPVVYGRPLRWFDIARAHMVAFRDVILLNYKPGPQKDRVIDVANELLLIHDEHVSKTEAI